MGGIDGIGGLQVDVTHSTLGVVGGFRSAALQALEANTSVGDIAQKQIHRGRAHETLAAMC